MRGRTLFFLALLVPAARSQQLDDRWNHRFTVDKSSLAHTGRSPYVILEPGYQLTLEAGSERLVITVLSETKIVDGVETRVVEERETKSGQLVEISRNFFAIHRASGDVYYFGEDVDMYKNGKIDSHDGAWLSGVNGARFGLALPGRPAKGQRYYQEVAPKVALDRAEIVGLAETVRAPAGQFKNCLKVRETTPLEFGVREHKFYAPGIGLVQDGSLKLVKYGPRSAP